MKRPALLFASLSLSLACDADPGPSPPSVPPLPEGASPVALCPIVSMIDAYPGEYPNQPNGPQPLASACITTRHDVVVVLGCPNDDTGTPSACQIARADIAVALKDAGYGDTFITTGGAVHNEWTEADTLRDLLVARGIEASRITTEPLAEHTDENIYYSTRIMEERGLVSALVVSDQPGHLVLTGVCDSNCCVDLGRLTVVDVPIQNGQVSVGHYVRHPWARPNTDEECAHIRTPSKFMCTNLEQRRACKDNFQL
ncbi:YdcF family protein [Polyangium sp. 6x1]|uniref:YdcF family protein n=1 Tax=Polyangium sp. 6x1 TaxID=3042689 RepID=UPI0024821BAB|nr:YdcF family protein [Polyangium sp. 6x1]MDI1442764.1 YdcF family protein [Polyangium sp. 6x1]